MKNLQAFSLTLEHQVLWVRAQGTWHGRTALDYIQAFRELVLPITARPWAVVLDIRHWQLCPVEVFTLLKDNTRWCFEHNLRHVETICADNAIVMWQFLKATDITAPANLVSRVATDDAAARLSLQAAGFLDD
ncbi:hypothetical protein [Arsukibacterium sp.]|uniref:hypothetical protein n=1 Tax=Arsukibacterium sp. TaxID=1977258 RepID=UPI00299CD761|nr:hypothetical protein [Arsukibacterium sp.]MDX1678987.1 hypothetical protein [Arsukibacterium sp.]